MSDFQEDPPRNFDYQTPFSEARPFLAKVMLKKEALETLIPDPLNFNLVAGFERPDSIGMTVVMDGFQDLSPHMSIKPPGFNDPAYLHLGYKHFDLWRTENGLDIRLDIKTVKRVIQEYWVEKYKLTVYCGVDHEYITEEQNNYTLGLEQDVRILERSLQRIGGMSIWKLIWLKLTGKL